MPSSLAHLGLLFLLFAGTAQAKVSLHVQPGTVKPGELVLLRVAGSPSPPSGSLGDRPISFYAIGKDRHEALVPIPVEWKPGPIAIHVQIPASRATHPPTELFGQIDLLDASFRQRELKVDSKFVEPPPSVKRRMKADQLAFQKAFSQPFGPRLFDKAFILPRADEITAMFGDQRMFNGKRASQHYGIDLEGRVGDPVHAANDGRVVMVRDCFVSGRTVVLHHGANLYTTYFHLSRVDVTVGKKVKRGERLGQVGKSGRVTGPHLHWGVKVDGLYVDGQALLALRFR